MKTFIVDPGKLGITAEDAAMLMALYSRSPLSVVENLEKVRRVGPGKFMSQHYCGYGHKSIGDCGDTDLYFENVSTLAAKAIQDFPLYRGQETSSRYLNFLERPLVDPLGLPALHQVWMNFYALATAELPAHLKTLHPIQAGENEQDYEKAIKTRVFDVARGFLPAGVTTQVGWSADLRQAGDRLIYLMDHPLPEVQLMALRMFTDLEAEYPNSFQLQGRIERGREYRQAAHEAGSFWDPGWEDLEHFHFSTTIGDNIVTKTERPRGEELPWWFTELGTCRFEFLQDFGSFRDVQRHRPGVCRMPLLTTRYGFENWYREMLPKRLQMQLAGLLFALDQSLNAVDADPRLKQYYIPMGFRVPVRLTYGLPSVVYMLELRCQKTVHPTLRPNIQRCARAVQEEWGRLFLHVDYSEDDWTLRRGAQDIREKETV